MELSFHLKEANLHRITDWNIARYSQRCYKNNTFKTHLNKCIIVFTFFCFTKKDFSPKKGDFK